VKYLRLLEAGAPGALVAGSEPYGQAAGLANADWSASFARGSEAGDGVTRRWPSLAASVLASLCVGFGYAWSVLLKPLAGGMGWSAADVSLSFTALMTMGAVAAIVVGKAQQYVQPRTLTLIGGALFGVGMVSLGSVHTLGWLYAFAALAGLGMGTVYPGATMSNAIRFFPDRRGLASGLLTAGYGLGAVVWAPVSVFLIGAYGLSWTFRILGATFFVIVATCSVMVRTAPEGYAPAGRTPPQ
jgi:OFA family oxalate/formate antiporter-like MFS transporter